MAKHKRPAPHTLSPQRPSGPPLCKRGGHAGGRGWRGSGCGNLSTRTFTNLLDPQRHPSVPRTHYLPSTKGTKPRPETPIPPCSHSVALGYSACSAGAQAGPAVQSQGWVGLALALAARAGSAWVSRAISPATFVFVGGVFLWAGRGSGGPRVPEQRMVQRLCAAVCFPRAASDPPSWYLFPVRPSGSICHPETLCPCLGS